MAENPRTTITVQRKELIALKRAQLEAQEAEGRKPSMSEMIRRCLDALAALNGKAAS